MKGFLGILLIIAKKPVTKILRKPKSTNHFFRMHEARPRGQERRQKSILLPGIADTLSVVFCTLIYALIELGYLYSPIEVLHNVVDL